MRLESFRNPVEIHAGKHHPNVTEIHFDKVREGWRQTIMLRGDAHYDNIHSLWDAEIKHLDMAREMNAGIIDVGDLFCAMQGRGDPRANYDSLRPEHKRQDYLNALVEGAETRYLPYADLWWLLIPGNHETAVLKNHNFDLTSALVSRLNSGAPGAGVMRGGYGGWVRFSFTIQKTVRTSINLKYHHGSGGGGPVTRGTIDTARQAVYLPDADICVNGHVHESVILAVPRERFNKAGTIGRDYLTFVRTPTYKDEYGDGSGGFHIEKGRGPKPIGCVFGEFYFEAGQIRSRFWSELV